MSKSCQYRCFSVKTRISEKLSDHLVFRHNTLKTRQLTAKQLSANCLDGLQMEGAIFFETLYNSIADTFTDRIYWHRGYAYNCQM